MAKQFSEKRDSLWWVAAAPGIWGVHFTLSYATAAVWCAKAASRDGSLSGARVAIFVYTAVALALALGVFLRGLGAYRRTSSEAHIDTSESRHHFMGFTLLSLSGLSAVAIVYEALAAVFIGSCS